MKFSMKFAIGDRVGKATDDHEGGVVVAVFLTDDGNFRYAVDMEGYGALQFLTEEKLVPIGNSILLATDIESDDAACE
jgi:hypothetical protein